MANTPDVPKKSGPGSYTKKAVARKAKDDKTVPAGASTGALGNAPLDKVTTGLRQIFRSKGSPSGNASGEINPRT